MEDIFIGNCFIVLAYTWSLSIVFSLFIIHVVINSFCAQRIHTTVLPKSSSVLGILWCRISARSVYNLPTFTTSMICAPELQTLFAKQKHSIYSHPCRRFVEYLFLLRDLWLNWNRLMLVGSSGVCLFASDDTRVFFNSSAVRRVLFYRIWRDLYSYVSFSSRNTKKEPMNLFIYR